MASIGKDFEKDFRSSVPKGYFAYRFKDGTASWDRNSSNVRFQHFNICDFMVFAENHLWLLELKSHKGKSVPIDCIRQTQIDGLIEAQNHDGIHAGIIFNMSDLEQTYFMPIRRIVEFIESSSRKSFPLDWIKTGLLIPQTKKKVHYNYDLMKLVGR